MKKTKKRKSAVALLQKRKSFLNLFIKRWVAILLLSIIVYDLGVDYFVDQRQDGWKNTYYCAKDAIIEAINNGPQDETYEQYINRVEYVMAYRQEVNTASLLCNAETGEIIADCKEKFFVFRKIDEGKIHIYTCPTSEIEGWAEYRQKFVEYKDKYVGNKDSLSLREHIQMDHIYVKGEHFLPGEFSVENSVYDINKGDLETVLTSQFEEEKDLSTDYVKTELTGEWKFWWAWGYNENDTTNYSGSNEGYQELQENYQHFLETGKNYFGGEFYTEHKMILSEVNELTMPNGEEALLMTVYYYDVWEDFSTWIILAGILIFVLGIILSLIWAKLSHIKLKAQYDMEDYRKTLMNTMAHDLKSPLMSISGYAENLKNNVNTDKKDHYAESILGNVNYMNGIIESVLTLGKTENEKLVLKKEKTSVAALFRECNKKYELQMNFKNLKLNIEGDGVYNIDVLLFTQAIDNLVGNAVKYASEKSEVNVKISNSVISISNKCDSMPEVSANELCEAFVVGNENRSNKTGSGLGLAIVKNVCDLHKFNLEIKCENNEFTVNIGSKKWR